MVKTRTTGTHISSQSSAALYSYRFHIDVHIMARAGRFNPSVHKLGYGAITGLIKES
jgi:hypothetical protein